MNIKSALLSCFASQRIYYLFMFTLLGKQFYVYEDRTFSYKIGCYKNHRTFFILFKPYKILNGHTHTLLFVFLLSNLLCITWLWLRWVFKRTNLLIFYTVLFWKWSLIHMFTCILWNLQNNLKQIKCLSGSFSLLWSSYVSLFDKFHYKEEFIS